jgi:hypothetical protein
MPPEWFRFFRDQQGAIAALESAPPAEVSGFLPDTTIAEGQQSVQATGSLASGAVFFRLVGDSNAPGNGYLYGTGDTGVKGWRSIASAFVAGTNITLTTAPTGVTTIDAAGGASLFTRIDAAGDIRITASGDLRITD